MIFWTILFLPLLSFTGIILFFPERHRVSALVSTFSAFLCAGLAVLAITGRSPSPAAVTWLQVIGLQVNIGIYWNSLSQLMLGVVTIVGALVHLYSWGYMQGDPGRGRYFAFLSLFMFSMTGIVLADNLIMMFIFWELVGLSSYLLIGFWFERPAASDAGKKAFLVNKIGDLGFILGIIMVWLGFGTVNLAELAVKIAGSPNPFESPFMTTLAALLIFCGAVGKSAQFPLHVWLPDAMEGPTPVSALIHAATMVAAGVYMLCRVFILLSLSPSALEIISWVGGITALLAAAWAMAQDDIKRILAYSTLSQLGYMVMAVGLASPSTAMHHLTTHAAFKALLFLGAGSVIVALHHEQNIWNMGGLSSRMRLTSITFLVGMLALCGVPFFSGAISKDAILHVAAEKTPLLFALGIFTAFLTSFYMARLFLVAFMGNARGEAAKHAEDNSISMSIPLYLLAICSFSWFATAGFIKAPVEALFGSPTTHLSMGIHILLVAIPFLGMTLAFLVYGSSPSTDPLKAQGGVAWKFLASKFYIDEIYTVLVQRIQGGFATLLKIFDSWIIDGLGVKGATLSTICLGNFLRLFQTGNLHTYIVFTSLALGLMIYLLFMR